MHAFWLSFQCPFVKQATGHSKNYVRSEKKDRQRPSSLEFILLLHDFLQFSCCQTEAESVVVHSWHGPWWKKWNWEHGGECPFHPICLPGPVFILAECMNSSGLWDWWQLQYGQEYSHQNYGLHISFQIATDQARYRGAHGGYPCSQGVMVQVSTSEPATFLLLTSISGS